jgi:hypothetical protein
MRGCKRTRSYIGEKMVWSKDIEKVTDTVAMGSPPYRCYLSLDSRRKNRKFVTNPYIQINKV